MIDLVLTHLTHPWGPPWTLETLGDHWRPLATMPENGHFGHFDHFQAWSPRVAKGRQWSPRVSRVPGGPQGWVRWVRTKSIIFKSFSYMIFKIGPFPHWNPHYKRKWLVIVHFLVYKSENCFVGSLYPLANCVKGGSDSETKSLF